MRIALSSLLVASALALALPAVALAQGAVALPPGMDAQAARAGNKFWIDRGLDRANDWGLAAAPSIESIPKSSGRRRIGEGRRAYVVWSEELDGIDNRLAVCDLPNGDVYLYFGGQVELLSRSVDQSGAGPDSLYNRTTTRVVQNHARTPLDLTTSETGMTLRVERAVGIDFDRDSDVLDRFSRAYRSSMERLSPLTLRFTDAERAAYRRDPQAFEFGVSVGISGDCP